MTTQFLTIAKLKANGAPRVSITEKTQATVQTIIDVVNDYIEGKVRSGYPTQL